MKKLLLLLFAAILVLAGCTSNEEQAVEQQTKETLTWLGEWATFDPNTDPMAQYLYEQTGQKVNYQMLPAESQDDKLYLELSSGSDIDMVRVTTKQYAELVSQGAVADLGPSLEKYGQNILDAIPEEMWATVTDPETGAIYGIPEFSSEQNTVTWSLYYRADILEAEGIPVPETTDDLLAATCTLAERGYQAPFATNWGSQYEYTVRAAFGVPYSWNEDENGELVYYGTDPRYLEYLEFMNQMYECGGLGADYGELNHDLAFERFINGESVFMVSAWWEQQGVGEGLEASGLAYEDVVGSITGLTGPSGFDGGTWGSGPSVTNVVIVPEYQAAYTDQIIQYLNQLMEPEIYKTINFGEEGVNYVTNDDGTVTVMPGTENKYVNGYWFRAGSSEEIGAQFFQAGQDSKQELYIDGDTSPSETGDWGGYAYMTSSVQAQEQGDVMIDPMANLLYLPLYSEVSAAMDLAVADFTVLYIAGQKTEEDFAMMTEQFKSEYNLDAVTEEVNAAYDFKMENQ